MKTVPTSNKASAVDIDWGSEEDLTYDGQVISSGKAGEVEPYTRDELLQLYKFGLQQLRADAISSKKPWPVTKEAEVQDLATLLKIKICIVDIVRDHDGIVAGSVETINPGGNNLVYIVLSDGQYNPMLRSESNMQESVTKKIKVKLDEFIALNNSRDRSLMGQWELEEYDRLMTHISIIKDFNYHQLDAAEHNNNCFYFALAKCLVDQGHQYTANSLRKILIDKHYKNFYDLRTQNWLKKSIPREFAAVIKLEPEDIGVEAMNTASVKRCDIKEELSKMEHKSTSAATNANIAIKLQRLSNYDPRQQDVESKQKKRQGSNKPESKNFQRIFQLLNDLSANPGRVNEIYTGSNTKPEQAVSGVKLTEADKYKKPGEFYSEDYVDALIEALLRNENQQYNIVLNRNNHRGSILKTIVTSVNKVTNDKHEICIFKATTICARRGSLHKDAQIEECLFSRLEEIVLLNEDGWYLLPLHIPNHFVLLGFQKQGNKIEVTIYDSLGSLYKKDVKEVIIKVLKKISAVSYEQVISTIEGQIAKHTEEKNNYEQLLKIQHGQEKLIQTLESNKEKISREILYLQSQIGKFKLLGDRIGSVVINVKDSIIDAIQDGKNNNYCGGYVAHLVANKAIAGDFAWTNSQGVEVSVDDETQRGSDFELTNTAGLILKKEEKKEEPHEEESGLDSSSVSLLERLDDIIKEINVLHDNVQQQIKQVLKEKTEPRIKVRHMAELFYNNDVVEKNPMRYFFRTTESGHLQIDLNGDFIYCSHVGNIDEMEGFLAGLKPPLENARDPDENLNLIGKDNGGLRESSSASSFQRIFQLLSDLSANPDRLNEIYIGRNTKPKAVLSGIKLAEADKYKKPGEFYSEGYVDVLIEVLLKNENQQYNIVLDRNNPRGSILRTLVTSINKATNEIHKTYIFKATTICTSHGGLNRDVKIKEYLFPRLEEIVLLNENCSYLLPLHVPSHFILLGFQKQGNKIEVTIYDSLGVPYKWNAKKAIVKALKEFNAVSYEQRISTIESQITKYLEKSNNYEQLLKIQYEQEKLKQILESNKEKISDEISYLLAQIDKFRQLGNSIGGIVIKVRNSMIDAIQEDKGNNYCGGYVAYLVANKAMTGNCKWIDEHGVGINVDDVIQRNSDFKLIDEAGLILNGEEKEEETPEEESDLGFSSASPLERLDDIIEEINALPYNAQGWVRKLLNRNTEPRIKLKNMANLFYSNCDIVKKNPMRYFFRSTEAGHLQVDLNGDFIYRNDVDKVDEMESFLAGLKPFLEQEIGYTTIGNRECSIVIQYDADGNLLKNTLKITKIEKVNFPASCKEITWVRYGSGSNATDDSEQPVLAGMMTWSVLPGLNIITGRNGAGKSQLLKYVSKTLFHDYNDNVFFMPPDFQHDGHLGEEGPLFDLSLRNSHIAYIEKAIAKKAKLTQEHQKKVKKFDGRSSDIKKKYHYLVNVIDRIYYEVDVIGQSVADKFDTYIRKAITKMRLQDPGSYLSILFDRWRKQKKGLAPWEQINFIIKRYTGLEIKVYEEEDQYTKLLKWRVIDRRGERDFDDLSSGEKFIFSMVAWLYGNEGNKAKIMLLDEPDKHLDPSLCRLFYEIVYREFVSEQNIQVIMTTHRIDTIALTPEFDFGKPTVGIFTIHKGTKSLAIEQTHKVLALSRLSRNLREVTGFHVKVYTEGFDDAIFYKSVYKLLLSFENGISKNRLFSRRWQPEFHSVCFDSGKGGGSTIVARIIVQSTASYEKLVSLPGSPFPPLTMRPFGILDDDYGKSSFDYKEFLKEKALGLSKEERDAYKERVEVLTRHSLENFLYDPFVLSSILTAEEILENVGNAKLRQALLALKSLCNDSLQRAIDEYLLISKEIVSNVGNVGLRQALLELKDMHNAKLQFAANQYFNIIQELQASVSRVQWFGELMQVIVKYMITEMSVYYKSLEGTLYELEQDPEVVYNPFDASDEDEERDPKQKEDAELDERIEKLKLEINEAKEVVKIVGDKLIEGIGAFTRKNYWVLVGNNPDTALLSEALFEEIQTIHKDGIVFIDPDRMKELILSSLKDKPFSDPDENPDRKYEGFSRVPKDQKVPTHIINRKVTISYPRDFFNIRGHNIEDSFTYVEDKADSVNFKIYYAFKNNLIHKFIIRAETADLPSDLLEIFNELSNKIRKQVNAIAKASQYSTKGKRIRDGGIEGRYGIAKYVEEEKKSNGKENDDVDTRSSEARAAEGNSDTRSYLYGRAFESYHADAMDQLLELRLCDISKLQSMGTKRLDTQEGLFRKDVVEIIAINYKVIIPVLIPSDKGTTVMHLVGIALARNHKEITVTYFNSENASIQADLVDRLTKQLLDSNLEYKISFEHRAVEQQRYNNCGPEVIENFIYYLTGRRATQEGAIVLHSLLLENALLDPELYQLKIEENKKFIRLLSNTAPISIQEVALLRERSFSITASKSQAMPAVYMIETVNQQVYDPKSGVIIVIQSHDRTNLEFQLHNMLTNFVANFIIKWNIDLLYKKLLYYNDLKRFDNIVEVYDIEIPNGLTAIDILRNDRGFKRKILLKVSPDKNPNSQEQSHKDTIFVHELREKLTTPTDFKKLLDENLQKLNAVLRKTNIGFKLLDIVVDVARLAYEPTLQHAKKAALDTIYLYGMYAGVNGYSVMVGGGETLYQLYSGEYQAAFNAAITTCGTMALPYILLQAGIPYIGFAYGAYMAYQIGYSAIENTRLFISERMYKDATLRSIKAYGDAAKVLSSTKLQQIYDFDSAAKEYEAKLNNMLLEKTFEAKEVQSNVAIFEHGHDQITDEQISASNKISTSSEELYFI